MNNLAKLIAIFLFGLTVTMRSAGQEQHHPGDTILGFTGEKSSWHGYDRYDFLMDEETLAITPYKSLPGEGDGVGAPAKGQRRCIVVVPRSTAPGNPWSWQGCYWNHEPQTEVELLRRGFHIAFITPDPGRQWDAWYNFLTGKHGFSTKPAFVGMSKGEVNEYMWATAHPDKVSCIYADNPALWPESFLKLGDLAAHDVPLLHVCGSYDFLLENHTLAVENTYHQLGGRISVVIKEGPPHHPHSIRDPKMIADWIVQNYKLDNPASPPSPAPPSVKGVTFVKSYYYPYTNIYRYLKEEDTYATCRGPLVSDCYDRYDEMTNSPWKISGMTILMPKVPAPGNPWMFRANRIGREATAVDLALLAKGFYIVAAPVTSQAGPVREQWDMIYLQLTANGFSAKPAMEGEGTGAGEAYSWAIHNPEKVSCIYGENPVLRSLMSKGMVIDSLAPLARAGVPLLHVCGSLDPWLGSNTRIAEKKYKELGGKISVIIREGEGHYQLGPVDPKPVVDFISASVKAAALAPTHAAPVLHGGPPMPPAAIRSGDDSIPVPVFEGGKTDWHGYDRYDYVLDSSGGTIAPFVRPADEKFGVREPAPGQRRCIIVVPKKFAPSHPWSWRGCYWDYQPQVEVELLRRGFCIAYISAAATLRPDKEWEVWYDFLKKKGLSGRPAFVGMSRGGEFSYVWGNTHPDKVSCIYADNPGMNKETLEKFDGLAAADVPLLHVCGSIDPLFGENTLAIESLYQHLGGRISLIIKDGYGHHPHGLRDPGPIADFIEKCAKPVAPIVPPACVGAKFKRTNYYGLSESYGYDPTEKVYITRRGPWFTGCYNRYLFNIDGIAGAVVVTVPEKEAAGKPWVFRAGYAGQDAVVDLGLLARGYTIVTGPVSYNSDSLSLKDWNTVYQLMVDHGYAAKPVLEGAGGAAGEMYGWAIHNPGKVAFIYSENPLLRSTFSALQPLDGLSVLAKAGVRLLDVCGSADPGLAGNALASETSYKALGGQIRVIVKEGQGHYPLAPQDLEAAMDFIVKNTRQETKLAGTIPGAGAYAFDSTISRKVLENYLSRAITMQNLLTGQGNFDDNLRMLKSMGAKYIGRSVCQWGGEGILLKNFEQEKELALKVHEMDPDIILEACIFEIVSRQINEVPVPDWAFTALGMPAEKRNFRYDSMIYADGRMNDQWRNGSSVPDVSRPETKLMFYFLAVSYIDLGIEGIHFGQVELMNKNDPNLDHYAEILSLIRAYAARHARRHMLLCNSHVPGGGFVRDGHLLMDFHAFPLRIMEVPDKPQEAILKLGFSDGLYNRSKGGITYSGWVCEHLPYLVEFDNYGVSKHPGQPNPVATGTGFDWVWGYDEISWFAHQSKEYRSNWLRYAWDWVKRTDPNGFLEMPGSRTESSPLDHKRWYYANTAGAAVPDGLGDEEAIRSIWATDH